MFAVNGPCVGVLMTLGFLVAGLLVAGCGLSAPAYTPTPTKTPTPLLPPTATEAPAAGGEPAAVTIDASSAPDDGQASPSAEPVAPSAPPHEPTSVPTLLPPPPTPAPLATPAPPPPDPTTSDPPASDLPAAPIAPPRRGGDWDMEDGFYVWPSPHENYGGFVANGWAWFIKPYQPDANPPNTPRLNENKAEGNVYSGARSQEISFDYRTGEIGIYRTESVTPGHRYTIEAWAKYAPSPSGVALFLGIDLTGGGDFEAASVAWYGWRDMTPDWWVATQETLTATGDRMTIFLRAVHPEPALGGNTMFDNVSVTDLGPP